MDELTSVKVRVHEARPLFYATVLAQANVVAAIDDAGTWTLYVEFGLGQRELADECWRKRDWLRDQASATLGRPCLVAVGIEGMSG